MSEKFVYCDVVYAETNFSDLVPRVEAVTAGWFEREDIARERSAVVSVEDSGARTVAARLVPRVEHDGIYLSQSIFEIFATESAGTVEIVSRVRDFGQDKRRTHAGLIEFFPFITELLQEIDPQIETRQTSMGESVQSLITFLEAGDRNRFVVVLSENNDAYAELTSLERAKPLLGVKPLVIALNEDWFDEFNEEVGLAFSIPRRGLRVFSPGFDLEASSQAGSHPAIWDLGTSLSEFWESETELMRDFCQRNIAIANRRYAAKFQSDHVIQAHQKFQEYEIESRRNATASRLQGSDGISAEILELVQVIERERDDALEANGALQVAYESEKYQREISELYIVDLESEVDKGLRENVYLRGLLHELGKYDLAPPADNSDIWLEVPDSFADLTQAVSLVPYVEFTGSLAPVIELDRQSQVTSGIQRAWSAIHAMSDYAVMKERGQFAGSLYEYLNSDSHSGFKISIGALAMSESEQVKVNPEFRTARTFSVPDEVSGGGTIFMEPHVKLMTGLSNSPRMHFFDNTGGDHKIYIGYIGRHLPTPGTN